ncbi:hypothetical protein PybrP1_010784 [[Pythium] brassicae (nom. inval.)]|nr:hypothetical protein PybrP1_010784 [[Pythium] brassicae (nom. inval.)]
MLTKVIITPGSHPSSPAGGPPPAVAASDAPTDRPVARRHSALGVLSHTTASSTADASVSQDADNQKTEHKSHEPTIDTRLLRSMSAPIPIDAVADDSDVLADILTPAVVGNQEALTSEFSGAEGGEEEFEELAFDAELENDENQDGGNAAAALGSKHSIRLKLGLATEEGLMGHANEDRMIVEQNEHFHLLAVLDGHGGEWVADYVKAKLFPAIARCYDCGFDVRKLADTVDALDQEVQARATQMQDFSGACMVCVLLFVDEVTGAPTALTLNVGDCRALLHEARAKGKKANKGVGPNGRLFALSEDHCEANAKESARVLASGGYIEYGRIGGVLEPFRSIGDIDMKEREMAGWVIATPEIKKTPLALGRSTLVLATDGVWGSLVNQKAMAIARKHPGNPQAAADALVAAARAAGSMDDIAVVVAHV